MARAALKVVPASPPPSSRRQRSTPDRSGVVSQVREALRPRNRLATALGFALGGLVPVACYRLSHGELTAAALHTQLPAWLVLGGLVYSALTVYQWGRAAFRSGVKALGFVVLLEGVMIASATPWLSLIALGYLVAINGVATGCNLALKKVDE